MKRFILAVSFFLLAIGLMATVCSAAPYIVCNPYPSTATVPDYFSVVVDGGTAVQSTPYAVTGGVELHFDVAGLSSGSHTINVSACSNTTSTQAGGCSTATPFTFSKVTPVVPTGVGISGQ